MYDPLLCKRTFNQHEGSIEGRQPYSGTVQGTVLSVSMPNVRALLF